MAGHIPANGGVEIGQAHVLDSAAARAVADDFVRGNAESTSGLTRVSNDDVPGTILSGLNVDELVRPVEKAFRSRLATTQPVAGHMQAPGGGVVLVEAGPSPSSPSPCPGRSGSEGPLVGIQEAGPPALVGRALFLGRVAGVEHGQQCSHAMWLEGHGDVGLE
jgi:hypothetical protein